MKKLTTQPILNPFQRKGLVALALTVLFLLPFGKAGMGYAQITLEHYYPPISLSQNNLRLVNLSASGYKYAINDSSTLTLYNLNHTVFQTIAIPPIGYTLVCYNCLFIYYISEALFDTNPSNIEYLLYFDDNQSPPVFHIRIYDQSGNTLFSKDSVSGGVDANYISYQDFISYTSSGVKMILNNQYTGGNTVYSLPGTLPCNDCTGGQVTALKTNSNTPNVGISNYPNPASNQTTVQYTLPQGITTAELVFYSIQGVEVKRFQVTNAFNDVLISTADLEAGTYYYQIQAANGYSAGKKMIVIR
jgi:hypothetical protein